MILDMHTHIFPDAVAPRAMEKLTHSGGVRPYTDGTRAGLVASMDRAGIDISVQMPVHTRPDLVGKLNRALVEEQARHTDGRVLAFGGMHPACPDWRQQLRFLRENGIPGIKLHPAFQQTDLDDPAMLRIIGGACEEGLIVMTHAGVDISFLDHDFASPDMILEVLRQVQPDRLILAHMGGWGGWDRVERELAGAPVWFDSAFSLGTVEPADADGAPLQNLSGAAWLHLARRHGMDRVLFATDSPWADQADYLAQIRALPMTEAERQALLWDNAAALLGIQKS